MVRLGTIRISVLALAALAALAVACGGGEPDEVARAPEPTVSERDATPRATPAVAACSSGEEGTLATSDWPYPNYDAIGSRATFESTINSANVDRLAEAWRYELPGGGAFGAAATTPVIVGDTVYVGDLFTNVHAVDRETGQRRWLVDVGVNVFGPSGVAVDGSCVYANRAGRQIAAYSVVDGSEVWRTEILAAGGQVNIQPTVAAGVVLAATTSLGQSGARGMLFGLDAETGEILWSFDTIESDDLWEHPEINSGGGAWYTPSVDLRAGVSYWGTSNPYPFPGAPGFPNGSSREGDNRWTNSILAIEIDTGRLIWGHQAVPHDLFDRDTVLTGVAALDDGGQVVISTGKLGRVIGLDAGGAVLWDTPVGMHDNDELEHFTGELEVLPGSVGGVVTPIAIADGTIFVSVVNAPETYSGPEQTSGPSPRLGTFNSQLVAVDARTGTIVWDAELPGDGFGGATVVNDLVFTSVIRGQILAFDRETGKQVWSYQAPGGINGWPAVVDDMLLIPVGFGAPAVLLALRLAGS